MAEALLAAFQQRLRYPVNPLPWVNQAHPASAGLFLSAIASQKSFICLDRPRTPTTGSDYAANINGVTGPSSGSVGLGQNNSFVTFPNAGPATVPAALTAAAICITATSVAGTNFLISDNSGQNQLQQAGGNLKMFNGSAAFQAPFALAASTPYFIATSTSASGGAGIAVNLLTGAIQTWTSTSNYAPGSGTGGLGTLWIGNNPNDTGKNWGNYIAAAMWSSARLSMQQLLEWAQDPWGFWYDQRLARIMSSALNSAATVLNIALTGQSLTLTQGLLVATSSVALSGQSETLSQGTVVPALSFALAGKSLTLSQGSATANFSLALSGQSVGSAKGSIVSNIVCSLAGQSLTLSQGTIVASLSTNVALTGQSMSFTQGNVSLNFNLSLAGKSLGATQGSATAAQTIALSGQSMSLTLGAIVAFLSAQLGGLSVVSTQANLKALVSIPLNGLELLLTKGVLTAHTNSTIVPSIERTYRISLQNRVLTIEVETRQFIVSAEDREFVIDDQNRILDA